ncbi:zinc finger protein 831 [Talpa occidentalis]|uniref:zinc finger protein 831 n=1 Tax=Talpa occidentalis TaxID=50954 RepID=UPI00188DE909|nr:zinc finger protein 831 [Talpa occidentalis]
MPPVQGGACLDEELRDQPAPAPGPPGAPGGQASPHLTLGPVILPPPPEQGLAPTVFLKALPVPLHHTVPPGGLQPRAPLVTGGLDGASVPFILSPLLQPEGSGPAPVAGKPTLAVSIVGALPVLSPGLGPALGSPGRVRGAGRYLCPHCGRDCLKPSVLEKHVRSHTGERPFPCATCGVAFKTQSNLYKHRRTQTHLNNSRLSAESDGAGGGLPEGAGKAGGPSAADRHGDTWSQRAGAGVAPGTALSPGVQATTHPSPVARSLETQPDTVPCSGPPSADREAPSPGAPPVSAQPRWKLPEQKSPTAFKPCPLQQPPSQATCAEKSWEAKAPEGRLRKCESTDSGYLSRSDSAEQPLAPCSPLHGLWEQGAPAEGEGTPGPGERGAGLELEKRQLEERIARLISHNQAVVDDPQLDHVRPRKTGLSKQGSIDLPTPHTYRGSFHFDIRAREPGRRRPTPLCPARSTLTLLDKARPLFFHSVPTQLSTTVECVPVTRSNSLPFVEGTRTWQELRDPQGACPPRQKPLSPRPTPTPLGGSSGLTWVGVPSGHPRALIRQSAVEDRPGTPPGDTAAPAEDSEGARAAGKGRAAARKCGARKLQAFSQDKWQVYGNETFQRIYQKMKTCRPGGRKAKEARAGGRAEPTLPLQEEATGRPDTPPRDVRTPVCGDTPAGATLRPRGSPPASEGLVGTGLPKQRETAARAGGGGQTRVDRAASPPTLCCKEDPGLRNEDPHLSPHGPLELGSQLRPAPGPLDPASPGPVLPGAETGAGREEAGRQAPSTRREQGWGAGEPRPAGDKLPSERKKLKVEEQGSQEQLEPLGAGEAPGGPTQAISLPAESQDSHLREKPGGPRGSGRSPTRDRAVQPDVPSEAASSVALKRVEPRDNEPPLYAAAATPEPRSPLTPQSQAPSGLTTQEDTAFTPKYLLRLPQGETHPPLPVPRSPGQSQEPLCRRRWPGECPSSARPGVGTLLSPGPASGLAPGGADCLNKRMGVQGEERGDTADMSTPAAGEPFSSAAGAPRGTVSFLTTPSDIRHLCMGSTLSRARPSGDALHSWVPNQELGAPPGNALEDPTSGPLAGPRQCGQPSWPEPASSAHSGTPWGGGAQSPFPTLRTEPRLTWCCLSRSLPLPAEQKGRAASVYLALHAPGRSLPDEGRDTRPVSKAAPARGGQTSASQDGGGPARPPKAGDSIGCAPGPSQAGPSRRPALTFFRLLAPMLGTDVFRGGPQLQGELACATSEPPLRGGHGAREDGSGAGLGSTAGAAGVDATAAGLRRDTSPPAGDRGPQDTAEASGSLLPSTPGWAGARASLLPLGNDRGGRRGPDPTAPRDGAAPADPGQPTGFPAALARTIKKRSLEGMRKQTRVEFSDTSSDDEDRLVIEI